MSEKRPDSPEGRTCKDCGCWRPAHLLTAGKTSKFGLTRTCKACNQAKAHSRAHSRSPEAKQKALDARNARLRQRYEEDSDFRERMKLRNREGYAKDAERRLTRSKTWRLRNADAIKRRSVERWAREKDCPRRIERRREWERRNREEIAAKRRDSYLANRERRKKQATERYHKVKRTERFRALRRAARSRRRAAQAGAPGSHGPADVLRLWHRQRGECARCGSRFGKRPSDGGYHVDHVTPLSRGGSDWPRNLQLLCPPCNLSKQGKTPAEFTLYNHKRQARA